LNAKLQTSLMCVVLKPRENFSGVLLVYNSIYHKCTELILRVIMQLLNAYAKPLLLCGLEAVNPSEQTLTRIITAWNSAIQKCLI